MLQAISDWDTYLLYAANGSRNAFLDAAMSAIALTWFAWAVGAAAFLIWAVFVLRGGGSFRRRLRKILFGLVLLLVTAGVTDLLHNEVKYEFGRARPYQSLPLVHYKTRSNWLRTPADFTPSNHRLDSFFSGHAAQSMALAVAAASICPPLSPAIYAMPLVVGYSRVYMGRHYPTDVLAGWAVGALVALCVRRLFRGVRKTLVPDDPETGIAPGALARAGRGPAPRRGE